MNNISQIKADIEILGDVLYDDYKAARYPDSEDGRIGQSRVDAFERLCSAAKNYANIMDEAARLRAVQNGDSW